MFLGCWPCWSGPCALPVERPRRRWSSRRFAFVILNIQFNLQYAKYFLGDLGGFFIFYVLYLTLLHLPPLRFHCADGCWDRTQDRCNWCIGSRPLLTIFIEGPIPLEGLGGLCHEMDWTVCVMRWIGRTVSWDGLGGLCHAMDWADCVMRWIRQIVS